MFFFTLHNFDIFYVNVEVDDFIVGDRWNILTVYLIVIKVIVLLNSGIVNVFQTLKIII